MELFKILGKFAIKGLDKATKELDDATETAKETKQATEKFSDSLKKLTSKVANQRTKIDLLKQKYSDLCLTQGKTSKEAEECAEEIKRLSNELKKNKSRLNEAKSAADKLDAALDDVGDSADKGSGKLGSLSSILGTGLAKAAAIGAAGLGAVAAAAVSVADNTREYRTDLGKLDAAFKMSGYSSETAKETYRSLQSVLGETDTAVEAANHLAKLCNNEQELQTWTDICTGVFATFGDSLPIEGLTEAANETAKVGQVTGVLADALNWAGVSEDAFNASLAACNSEQERAALITETLNGLYSQIADTYKRNNEAVIEANAAQEEWNEAMAKVGAIVEPIISLLKSGLAKAISYVADSLTSTKDAANALAGEVSTVEEAEAKLAELQARMDSFPENPDLWTDAQRRDLEATNMAITQTKERLGELQQAQQATADAAKSSATATAQAVMSSAEMIPVDADTPVSVMAENMANDTSMETAATEAVERAGSSMETAAVTSGFDSAGASAMKKFIDGINSMSSAVMQAVDAIASKAVERMNSALNDIQGMADNASIDGRHKTGLNYVPFDGYIAQLHKGEAVLTAEEATAWRAGKVSESANANTAQGQTNTQSGITIVQNIQSVPQTPVEFAAATEAYFEQARWALA